MSSLEKASKFPTSLTYRLSLRGRVCGKRGSFMNVSQDAEKSSRQVVERWQATSRGSASFARCCHQPRPEATLLEHRRTCNGKIFRPRAGTHTDQVLS